MHERLYADTINKLKANGVRLTPQRLAIVRLLIDSEEHPTAEAIHQALMNDFPRMSVATIYNNLRLLVDLGLVEEMDVSDTATHFDFPRVAHAHAICTNCGRIVDFFLDEKMDLNQLAAEETGFVVSSNHLEVYGLCPQCQMLKTATVTSEDH